MAAEQDMDVSIRQTYIIFSHIFSAYFNTFSILKILFFLVRLGWFSVIGFRKLRKMQCRILCTISKCKFYLKHIKYFLSCAHTHSFSLSLSLSLSRARARYTHTHTFTNYINFYRNKVLKNQGGPIKKGIIRICAISKRKF